MEVSVVVFCILAAKFLSWCVNINRLSFPARFIVSPNYISNFRFSTENVSNFGINQIRENMTSNHYVILRPIITPPTTTGRQYWQSTLVQKLCG